MNAPIQRNHITIGDALEVAKTLPDQSIHCIITSPAYYGLRDYNVEGQGGLQETPQLYVEWLVTLFRELRRVLRNDGTLWLNLGDTYASSWAAGRRNVVGQGSRTNRHNRLVGGFKEKDLIPISWMVAIALQQDGWYLRAPIIWSKGSAMPESVRDRVTIAHEYIFMLTKAPRYYYDGQAIAEPVAESTPARQKRGMSAVHKHVNGAPGQTPHSMNQPRLHVKLTGGGFSKVYADEQPDHGGDSARKAYVTRNKRSVWTVNNKGSKRKHYAAFPEALIEPMVLAGCPKQCCAVCGAPYVRMIKKTARLDSNRPQAIRAMKLFQEKGLTEAHLNAIRSAGITDTGKSRVTQTGTDKNTPEIMQLAREAKEALGGYYREFVTVQRETLGFTPSCVCETTETMPGITYDPFMGSGTVAVVARRLGRDYAGSELNPQYVAMAERRLRGSAHGNRGKKHQEDTEVEGKPLTLPLFGEGDIP